MKIPKDWGRTNNVAALTRGSGNGVVEAEFGAEGDGEVGCILAISFGPKRVLKFCFCAFFRSGDALLILANDDYAAAGDNHTK